MQIYQMAVHQFLGPLSVAFGDGLDQGMMGMFLAAWVVALVMPWMSLAGMAIWVVATCLVAGLPPALIAARLQPAAVLREDE